MPNVECHGVEAGRGAVHAAHDPQARVSTAVADKIEITHKRHPKRILSCTHQPFLSLDVLACQRRCGNRYSRVDPTGQHLCSPASVLNSTVLFPASNDIFTGVGWQRYLCTTHVCTNMRSLSNQGRGSISQKQAHCMHGICRSHQS